MFSLYPAQSKTLTVLKEPAMLSRYTDEVNDMSRPAVSRYAVTRPVRCNLPQPTIGPRSAWAIAFSTT